MLPSTPPSLSAQGELQDVRLLPGPYGYLLQCEHMDSQCPTCGQFLQLQSFIMELQQNLSQLNQRVSAAHFPRICPNECSSFIPTVRRFNKDN
jgi:hypothetical protein